MKKTTFNAIVNAIEAMADARLDVDRDYLNLSDEEIKEVSQIHFFFDEVKVNERSATCKKACKRVSFNANMLVLNKTFAEYFIATDNEVVRREMLISKNYCNVKLPTEVDYTDLLQRVRNAYFESIAQSLGDALEIEFTTQVKKSRKGKKQTA